MRIGHIVPSLDERHGGPSRSVRRLAAAQAALGHDVELLSTTDAGELSDRADGLLRVIEFRRDRPQYLCPSVGLRNHLLRSHYDCVHHHALWLRPLHYAHRASAQMGVPMVVSPRGMLTAWAWKHHRWKKRLASRLVHPGALASAAGWHATSAEEAADIRQRGFGQPAVVASNGVDAPSPDDARASVSSWTKAVSGVAGRRVALFYSRFHRKKRVLELVDLWAAAAPRDWLLLIVGIPEEFSVADVARRAARAGASDRIEVRSGLGCPPPFGVASLFVLPSHSENFGMSIAESMAWGLPIVVTDTTPWSEAAAAGAGSCVSWDDYADALRSALSASPEQLKERGEHARRWVLERCSWTSLARDVVEFYARLIAARDGASRSRLAVAAAPSCSRP